MPQDRESEKGSHGYTGRTIRTYCRPWIERNVSWMCKRLPNCITKSNINTWRHFTIACRLVFYHFSRFKTSWISQRLQSSEAFRGVTCSISCSFVGHESSPQRQANTTTTIRESNPQSVSCTSIAHSLSLQFIVLPVSGCGDAN